MSDLVSRLKGVSLQRHRKSPLWEGPQSNGEHGGITFSMLSRYLVCKERFRLYAIEGLKTAESFEPRIEYGNMWHVCEEALAAKGNWQEALLKYAKECAKKYPTQGQSVDHWYGFCKTQFPLYQKHWASHPDVKKRVPIFQERVFNVPYTLPSGKVVHLRGKFDSVDFIQEKPAGIYVQENKTKSQIDHIKLTRQLTFDLQTMIYLIALRRMGDEITVACPIAFGKKVCGTRYNVIKRSAHKQGQKETKEGFFERFAGIVTEAPEDWFARFRVEVSEEDISRFSKQCLNPLLEEVCCWYEAVRQSPFEPWNLGDHSRHYRYPYGIYNTLNEGGFGDVDSYMDTGSEVGLRRVDTLFSELQ